MIKLKSLLPYSDENLLLEGELDRMDGDIDSGFDTKPNRPNQTWNSDIWKSNIWKSDIWKSNIWPSQIWENTDEKKHWSKYIVPLINLAKHFDKYDDFQFYYCCKNFHGLYWHLTDNPDFKINPKQSPTDMSSLVFSQNKDPGLMVTTDISNWDATFRGSRKYVALIDLSNAKPNVDYKTTTRGFGHEMYIFVPEKASVVKVLPIRDARRLQSNIYKKILPDTVERLKQIFDYAHKNKTQLSENSDNSHEEAAIKAIKFIWKKMGSEDKFSQHLISVYMNNDRQTYEFVNNLAKTLYPTDEEPIYTFLSNDIEPTLQKLEYLDGQKKLTKMGNDPLFLLKSVVKGKSWEGAKQSLSRVFVSRGLYPGGRVPDELVENLFTRLYKLSLGETMFEKNFVERNNTPRLSDLSVNDGEQEKLFIKVNAGTNMNKFPDIVTVYRGTNSPMAKIRPGDFVTFNSDFARAFKTTKLGMVHSAKLKSKDLVLFKFDPYDSELIYWPEGHEIKKVENVPTFKEFWMYWSGK